MVISPSFNGIVKIRGTNLEKQRYTIDELSEPLQQAHAYWDLTRRHRKCPYHADIELMEFPYPLAPTMMVYDICDPIENSIFRYWGTGMTRIYGRDMTGKSLTDFTPQSMAMAIAQSLQKAINTCGPVADRYEFNLSSGANLSTIVLRMPMMDDQGYINRVLSFVELLPEHNEILQEHDMKLRYG